MSSTNLFSVHFIARPLQSFPGEVQIYVRITISKKRLELSLKKKVPIQYWDVKNGAVTGIKNWCRN